MTPSIERAQIDWLQVANSLDDSGFAVTDPVLTRGACEQLIACYADPSIEYRSTINMARYNFGSGEYKYFAYPLPNQVRRLREHFYPGLANIANEWEARLSSDILWPDNLADLTRRCHAAGQNRPTPLLLKYTEGDYNCLHQDLYGPIHFPLQVVILLTEPGQDFEGGELTLVEQRPRMQSRPMVIHLKQGAAAIFPVRDRPGRGKRGFHRLRMRHGVSSITRGSRLTLGLIFHDAA